MSPETRTKYLLHWGMTGVLIVVIGFLTVWGVQKVQEYNRVNDARAVVWNEVSYPQGNVGTVLPDEVAPGGVIVVTYKEYCNRGVDVVVTRWLDFLGPDGKTPVASYGLTPIEFYGSQTHTPGSSGCHKNLQQPFGMPTEIAGRPPGDSTVRLRTVTSYVKPEQVISVPAYSETFTLLGSPTTPKEN